MPTSKSGKYLSVKIEHFTIWVKLVPLQNKTINLTASTFLETVPFRFGALAKVVTDQGSEFKGEFTNLLNQHGIDHRLAYGKHPHADGLAECVRQTLEQDPKKSRTERAVLNWDLVLPYVSIGHI